MTGLKQYKCIRENVYYAHDTISDAGDSEIRELCVVAEAHPRKRSRICFHENSQSTIQEMLVVFAKGIYLRPLKQNLERTITYVVVRGVAELIEFEDNGQIKNVRKVGAAQSGYPCFFKVKAASIRTFDVLSDFFIFVEVNEGPFTDAMTEYPEWSKPEQGEENINYLKSQALTRKLNLDGYRIRAVELSDYAALYELHCKSMGKHIARVYGWDEKRQAQLFRERFTMDDNWVIENDGNLVGCIRFFWREDHYFLDNITLHQNYQNKGLGERLISRVLDDANIRLQVYKGSEANRFYERIGFIKIEEKPNHNIYVRSLLSR